VRSTFPIVILIGRPAAGKSEVIDFLKRTSAEERAERFHIGEFTEIDDFPYIWDWFEEDDILERHGRERLHTRSDYYFKDEFLWNVCIEKINLAYEKYRSAAAGESVERTAIIEFARGGDDAFAEAFSYLSEEIIAAASILYIRVSYEESVRRNRKRAKIGEEHSILHHSLPDDKMDYYYRENDWDRLAKGPTGLISVKGIDLPYSEFANEPEVTHDLGLLGAALEKSCSSLWDHWAKTRAPESF